MVTRIVVGKKKRKVTEGPVVPPRPERLKIPFATLLRSFLIGSVAVIACIWAIWRYYYVPRTPMIVPATPAPSASEIEIEPPP
jgi:hypothetical protein